jgi:tetratricopeptide (TPR) repeat protein
MGECKMQLGYLKEAVQFFSTVVRVRPKSITGWEALIRCLYKAEHFAEARQQVLAALKHTNQKPVFLYYLGIVLLALGKKKDALLNIEKAIQASPKFLKKFVQLFPSVLQDSQVIKVIVRNKNKRS